MEPTFLVYGATGYLGSHLVNCLKRENCRFNVGVGRLENETQLKLDLDTYKPDYVLCAAGLKGKPNVDWFENSTNHEEAYRINVEGQLTLARLCELKNIHCTLFGTGFLYNYDNEHPVGGVGFKEEDPPNWDNLHYVKLRILLEKKINEQQFPNLLNLRVNMPISDDFHSGSFLTKLITYPNIESVPCSFTVVDDLWPFILKMATQKIRGTFNFTNPGVISHDEILQLYKKHIKPDHTWNLVPNSGKRPACHLETSKLELLFPGRINHVKDAIEGVILRWKEKKELL